MKIISSDGHGDELFVSRGSHHKRLVFVASNKRGRETVIVAATPDDARKLAVQTVRIADMIDPPGSFVKPQTAWRRVNEATPPKFGTILVRDAHMTIALVTRPEWGGCWTDVNGHSVTFEEWAEVPR